MFAVVYIVKTYVLLYGSLRRVSSQIDRWSCGSAGGSVRCVTGFCFVSGLESPSREDLLALTPTHPDHTIIADRLFRFYAACAGPGLVEMERLATTVETWGLRLRPRSGPAPNNAGSEGTSLTRSPGESGL